MPKYEYVVYSHKYASPGYVIETAPCNKRFSLETIEGHPFAVFNDKHLWVDADGKLRHKNYDNQENTYALVFGDKLIFSAYCTAEKFKHAVAVGFERDPTFVDQYIKQVMDLYDTVKKAA